MQTWFPSNPTLSYKSSSSTPKFSNTPSGSQNGSQSNSQSGSGISSQHHPRARILCFHGAGSDATMFTSKGTAKRPLPNPLLTYCLDNDIELLAVHLPGRTTRLHEPVVSSPLAAAETILDLLEEMLSCPKIKVSPNGFEVLPDIPLVVVGHSMGAIMAYEFLCSMRHRELPAAKHVLLSCMIAPDTPKHLRPWTPAESFDSEGFKRECRGWRINEEVFTPDLWQMYEPILRKDMGLIDNYTFCEPEKHALKKISPHSSQSTTPAGSPVARVLNIVNFHAPLGINTTVFHADQDQRCTEEHVKKWKNIIMGSGLFSVPAASGFRASEGEFAVEKIPGGHNFFYEPEGRVKWMEVVIQVLDKILIDLEYGL